jgi:hypothetical protein
MLASGLLRMPPRSQNRPIAFQRATTEDLCVDFGEAEAEVVGLAVQYISAVRQISQPQFPMLVVVRLGDRPVPFVDRPLPSVDRLLPFADRPLPSLAADPPHPY